MNGKLVFDGGQAFVVFDDGARFPITSVPTYTADPQIALENGMIVHAGVSVSVARAERDYWRQLAEKRGVELADIKAGRK